MDARFQGIPDAVVEFVCNGDTTRTTTSASGHYSVVVTIQTVDVEVNLQPDAFVLHQNHPNPFNPTTTIQFDSPQNGNVSLTVYSISGQKVATLADGFMEAGSHSAVFDGAGLASGVYIYRFRTQGFNKTGKIMLVK